MESVFFKSIIIRALQNWLCRFLFLIISSSSVFSQSKIWYILHIEKNSDQVPDVIIFMQSLLQGISLLVNEYVAYHCFTFN